MVSLAFVVTTTSVFVPQLPLIGPGRAAAFAAAPPCSTTPAASPVIAAEPWSQQRYDLVALGQINDGAGTTVAVLDSGVDAHHPQLRGALSAGTDVLDPPGDAWVDCVGHGTAVASIIAARAAPGSGLRGLAPGSRILPVRVSERVETDGVAAGDGNVAELAAGLRAALDQRPRPDVINLSIATTVDNPALRQAVAAAVAADIVVVAAVGNQHDRGDPIPYPASYPGVIGVGAIGPDDARLPTSQTGSYVDIVAPGAGISAAAPGGGHIIVQGTSFAAPFVSATAALIRGRWPGLNRSEVERRLLATADPPAGDRSGYGAGVLNPLRALTAVLAPPNPATPATAAAAPPPRLPRRPTDGGASGVAAAILFLLGASLATVAAAVPAARRRRWRPGRI
jgi:type VII secretion-associated serine protease mycosin